jgi:hypothetical protein
VRILFLTHYFHPEVGAPQSRLLDLANELSRRGHEVTVLTGFPNYPTGVDPGSIQGPAVPSASGWESAHPAGGGLPAPNRGVARRLLNHASSPLLGSASPAAGPADQ